jgi:hypothetical protein
MIKGSRIKLRQSKTIFGSDDLPRYAGPILSHWKSAAGAKGYEVVGRVLNKDHLLLECDACGLRHAMDLHRFRSGQVFMLGGPLFEGHG